MTPVLITLGLYVVGILGGAYVGHELTAMHFREQLAKFHTQRDEKGRFTKRV